MLLVEYPQLELLHGWQINTIYWNGDVYVILIDPVVFDKKGVHNNVKFVVSFDVSVYVEDNVPPWTLKTKFE